RGLHPRRGGAPGAGRLGGGAPAAYAPRSRVPRGHRRDEASRLRHARAERHRLVPALEEGLFPWRRPDDASARARLLGRRIVVANPAEQEMPHLPGFCRALFRTRTGDPLSMKKGRASSGRFVHRPVMAGVGVVGDELGSSLYRLLEGGQGRLEFAPVAHLLMDRQAARGAVAPLGAKGWLRLSMCQIASDSRRARSIWATLAPRCLPIRAFVCVRSEEHTSE